MEHDKNTKGNMRNGVIEKVSNVLDYDYYDDPFGWGSGGLQQSGSGNPGMSNVTFLAFNSLIIQIFYQKSILTVLFDFI